MNFHSCTLPVTVQKIIRIKYLVKDQKTPPRHNPNVREDVLKQNCRMSTNETINRHYDKPTALPISIQMKTLRGRQHVRAKTDLRQEEDATALGRQGGGEGEARRNGQERRSGGSGCAPGGIQNLCSSGTF